jgi:hypothetical protein
MKPINHALVLLVSTLVLPIVLYAQDKTWIDRLDFSGDLRLRYEEIRRESEPTDSRPRYRARFGMSTHLSDNVEFVVGIASGAYNPVSRNVTIDGELLNEGIGIDLLYIDWTPVGGMHVYIGKMKNPLFRAGNIPLVWDGDWNPKGIALNYSKGWFFGVLGSFLVEDRSSSSDSILLAGQVGAKFNFGENSTLTAGVGYFGYSNTIGNKPFYHDDPKGNTVDLLGNYVYEYKDTELLVQYDTKIGNLPFSLFAQSARNSEVIEQDFGIAYGARLGSAKDKGQWELVWGYQDIEADSVIGTFNNSDFGGGGTDATGHIFVAKYVISKNIDVGGTLFINRINPFSLPEEDYERLQLDVVYKFK